jgi:hypothetical protein
MSSYSWNSGGADCSSNEFHCLSWCLIIKCRNYLLVPLNMVKTMI